MVGRKDGLREDVDDGLDNVEQSEEDTAQEDVDGLDKGDDNVGHGGQRGAVADGGESAMSVWPL